MGAWHATPLPKTIGHSYCVPNRVNQTRTVEAVLTRLVERAGRRMRKLNLLAARLSIAAGFRQGGGWFAEHKFPEPDDDPASLVSAAAALLHRGWHGQAVDFLAVTLGEFSMPTRQMGLMADAGVGAHGRAPLRQKNRIANSLDRIRDRHGEEAIVFGRMFKILGNDDAPDRIGFRKTVGEGWENAGTRGF